MNSVPAFGIISILQAIALIILVSLVAYAPIAFIRLRISAITGAARTLISSDE